MTQKDIFEILGQVDQLTQTMTRLSINKNQFTAFVGGTGQGKSTLVNVIHGVQLSYQKKPGGIYHIFANQKNLNSKSKIQIEKKVPSYSSTYQKKFNCTPKIQIENKKQSYRSTYLDNFNSTPKIQIEKNLNSYRSTYLKKFNSTPRIQIENEKHSYRSIYYKTLNNTPKIQIGNKKQSCTRIPNVYDFNGVKSADLIGWFDTQNQKQQIINGFLNSGVLSKGKKIKIVMVNSIHTLQAQRGGNFVRMIQILYDMFQKDFTKICDSFLIVFSKINTQQWTQQGIYQELNQIINFNQNLNELTKKFLKMIIKKKNIALFPTPDKLNQDHIQKIKYMINNLKYITLQNGSNISLSASAINLKNKIQNFVLQNSYKIIKVYEKLIKQKYQSRTYSESWQLSTPIKNLNSSLSKIQKIIKCLQNSKTKIKENQKNEMTHFSKLLYSYEQQKSRFSYDQLGQVYQQLNTLLGGKNNDLINLRKNIRMIQFCLKIDQNFNGLIKFLDSLQISIKSYLNQLQANRNTLQNQQQLLRLQRQQQQQRKREQRQWKKWKQNFERQQRRKLRQIQNEARKQIQAMQRRNRQQRQRKIQQIQQQRRRRQRQRQEDQQRSSYNIFDPSIYSKVFCQIF